MTKIFILLYICISFLFSQKIYHDPIVSVESELPIEIDIFTDIQGQNILNYNLFYRKVGQTGYFQEPLTSQDGTYYSAIIPSEFVISGDIEYYVLLEAENNIVSIPEVNPYLNPLTILVTQNSENSQNVSSLLQENTIINNVTIISPQPNSSIAIDDFVISISYFDLKDLDASSIKIYVDQIDVTSKAIIREKHLLLKSLKLNHGNHNIKISMKDIFNNIIPDINWSFNVKKGVEKVFKYNGKLWSDYLNNDIDDISTSYNSTNFNFKGNAEWINFNIKLKKTSLENKLNQPKDRLSILLYNKILDINIGDYYPQFDELTLNGNRVRGFGFDLHSKFFQLNLIKGQLNRAIQGHKTNALIASDFTDNIFTLSRNDYTFENEITAFRLGIGNRNKLNFGLNAVKVKDIMSSVNQSVSGSIVSLDFITDEYDSPQWVDVNDDDICDIGELTNDNENPIQCTEILHISESPEFINYEHNVIVIGTSDSGYPIKQDVWDITVLNKDLQAVLDNNSDLSNDNISVEYLTEQWAGNKPKDNIVVGTDFKLKYPKIQINSSLAMSLINENIWNPIKTIQEFDTYSDEYEDCYYGRTYNLPAPLENQEYKWENCELYLDENTLDDTDSLILVDIDNYIVNSGVALDDLPDPKDFSDMFHYNFDAVPLIPFYDLIDMKSNGEDVGFSDILKSPEVAYNLNVKLNYNIQKIQFGIKRVGSSFINLANPYLQNDNKEKYFSNRIKLLNNKLFVTLSWKNIKNGLLDKTSVSKTDKYDLNLNFHPGINLPTLTLNYGNYRKESGGSYSFEPQSLGYVVNSTDSPEDNECVNNNGTWDAEDEECYSNDNFDIDTRVKTVTHNFNSYITHKFKLFKMKHDFGLSFYKSKKEDELYDELSADGDYLSPQSNSQNINITIKTKIKEKLSTDFYLSHSYFDFAQKKSDFYQEQDIVSYRIGTQFRNKKIIDNVGAWFDFSEGDGNTEYNQYGLKMILNLKLYKDLFMNLQFRSYLKRITSTNSSNTSGDFSNTIIKANLSYKF